MGDAADTKEMRKTFIVPAIKPFDHYDFSRAKIACNLAWLVAKAFGTGRRCLFSPPLMRLPGAAGPARAGGLRRCPSPRAGGVLCYLRASSGNAGLSLSLGAVVVLRFRGNILR